MKTDGLILKRIIYQRVHVLKVSTLTSKSRTYQNNQQNNFFYGTFIKTTKDSTIIVKLILAFILWVLLLMCLILTLPKQIIIILVNSLFQIRVLMWLLSIRFLNSNAIKQSKFNAIYSLRNIMLYTLILTLILVWLLSFKFLRNTAINKFQFNILYFLWNNWFSTGISTLTLQYAPFLKITIVNQCWTITLYLICIWLWLCAIKAHIAIFKGHKSLVLLQKISLFLRDLLCLNVRS